MQIKEKVESWNLHYRTWIILLMGITTVFSLLFLTNQSLRLDESQTLWQVSNNIPRILNMVGQDVHVPLYHLILHFWLFYLGNTIFAARLLSLLFIVLTIPAVFVLGKRAFNPTIGLFAAVLTAISPFLAWYGSEIRMYSMVTLVTVINQIFFLNLSKKPSFFNWLGYFLTGVIGVYTHYFFLLILGAQFLFFLVFRKNFPRRTFFKLFAAIFLIALSLAPWAFYVYNLHGTSYSEPLLAKPTIINIFITFTQFLFGFQTERFNRLVIALWPIGVLFGFLSLTRRQRFSFEAFFFLFAAIVPILAAYAFSVLVKPVYLSRYLILTIPSLYLFLAWLFYHYPSKLANAFRYSLVVFMSVTLFVQSVSAANPAKEDFRDVANYLNQNVQPDDVIIVSAPFTIYPVEYYYKGPAQVITMPEWNRFVIGPIPAFSQEQMAAEVNSLKGTHRRAFVILSYDQGYEDSVRLYFDKNFQRLDYKNYSPGLDVYEYRLRYDI
ncbi:MAG: glycosyltransferase family 39 protein [Acidobacteriaceae bacterium]